MKIDRSLLFLMLSVLALAVGCGHGPPINAVKPAGGEHVAGQALSADEVAEAPGDKKDKKSWDCKKSSPPFGYEQATAYEPKGVGNATQVAMDNARRKLAKRLCGGTSNCDLLAANIREWKIGGDDTQVCAMMVIKREDVEAWRTSLGLESFDAALRQAAHELLIDMKKPTVVIDKVVDDGAAGGPRATWLSDRFIPALQAEGARIQLLPSKWNGDGMPKGIDVVINANALSRMESQRSVVEVSWKARRREGRAIGLKVASPVIFPAEAAPKMGSPKKVLPGSDPSLFVRLEYSHQGGSLCLGEQTRLWLHSDADMHVRVFDLYGSDGAFLLFPNSSNPSGTIKADQTLDLGGQFEAVPLPGEETERFLVIAAPTREGLEGFASYEDYCRVPTSIAAQLHEGRGLPSGPGARGASDGFRLIDDAGLCPVKPANWKRPDPTAALAEFPECK